MHDEQLDHILVVDDDSSMLWAVTRVLEPLYHVTAAQTPQGALRALAGVRFQVALVDIQLHGGTGDEEMDGYLLCQKIREHSPQTDVILMTGSISQPGEKLFRALEKDAFYFLFKPFERRVLRALIERCLRLQKERAAKEGYARELAQDLEQARDFQRSLLPKEPLTAMGWRLDGRFIPCDRLGGDLFFYQKLKHNRIVFTVSDIVGHGVRAAMYASMLRSTLDAARRNRPEPEHVLPEVMSGIDFFEDSRFASTVYGLLEADGSFSYFNAGHPPMYLLRRNGDLESLGATGLLLSNALRDYPRQVERAEMAPGDRLLIYTDGVNEAVDPEDRPFDFDGLEQALREGSAQEGTRALDHILGSLERHTRGRPLDDDLTLLLIERRD